MGVLTLDSRTRLLALLADLPQLAGWPAGRELLLGGLPPRLTDSIKWAGAKTTDLAAIVTTCELWPADPAVGENYPTRLLVQNAAGLADGSATGRVLADLLQSLPLTPPTGPPPCPYP